MGAWLLLALLACGPADPAAGPPADPASSPDPAAPVRVGLTAAVGLWQGGDGAAAAARVQQTSALDLAPLLPGLRAWDPQQSLEIEYAFGVLAAHATKKDEAGAFSKEADALATRVEDAVASAQAAAAPPPDPAAQSSAGSNGVKSP